MRVRPKAPACETRMPRIGVTEKSPQTPARSRISRLAWESAMGRKAPRAACCGSTRRTAWREARSASARVQPTGPAPRTRMSAPAVTDQRLDLGERLRGRRGKQHAAERGGTHVVFDPHAE